MLFGAPTSDSRRCFAGRAALVVFAVATWGGQGRAASSGSVNTVDFSYSKGKESFQGLLSKPSEKAEVRGGVLVVHNWMGVTDETKKQAERFASLGFVVVSADIYGKGVRPKDAKAAGALAGSFKSDRELFRKRLLQGFEELSKLPELKDKPLFAAGYCFGGTGVVELARTGAPVAGVLSFHGGLDSPKPSDGAKIRGKVLAFHGADDPFVPAADLAAFEGEMASNKVDWQLIKFGGAVHSFTDLGAGNDPSKGAAYDAKADARSWDMTRVMLDEWTKHSK